MKKISIITISIIMLLFGVLALSGCAILNTQAVRADGEPYLCFQARYQSREGNHEAARDFAKECPTELKREWCLKVLKERPEVFKDFNDCWRQ